MPSAIIEICNEKGLHARASAKFVKVVSDHDATVRVTKDDQTVEGDSILDLLMLGAAKGTSVTIDTEGKQADEALKALITLIETRFGEEA